MFQFEETSQAGNNWTIIVPFNQELNKSVKGELSSLTGMVTDYVSQFENYWKVNKQLEECGLLMFVIGRDDVESYTIIPFIDVFKRLEANKKLILAMRNKVNIMIYGYDDDERELYQIPEVRKWMTTVLENIDSWGFFLNMDHNLSGINILHLCTRDYKILGRKGDQFKVDFSPKEFKKSLDILFDGLNKFCMRHGISQKINEEQSQKIAECLLQEKIELKK